MSSSSPSPTSNLPKNPYAPLIDPLPAAASASPSSGATKAAVKGFGNDDFSSLKGTGPSANINMPPNNVPSSSPTLSTLDEPFWDTLKRDLLSIWQKIKVVLVPHHNDKALQDWDLWGPLLLCLTLSLILNSRNAQKKNGSEDTGDAFTIVFTIFWVGSAVITVNATLLGGKISFFQSVCVLGYCTFPLVIASIVKVFVNSALVFPLVVLGGYLWSIFAATKFLGNIYLPNRKFLALYPIIIFYFFLGYLILIL